MRKVLIWDISFQNANIGGPAGYLYNIREYLHSNPCEQIVFLSDLYPKSDKKSATSLSVKQKIFNKLKRIRFLYRINDLLFIVWKQYHEGTIQLPPDMDWSAYDYVHFHQANDVRRYAKLLKNTHVRVILTTHCPCPQAEEQLAEQPWYYRMFASWVRWQERLCYKTADYIMFPCIEAREPYEKDIRISNLFHSIEHKFFYCPSAILDIQICKEQQQKLSSFGIPENAFVIAFFGRHNEVKGYDILKSLGENLLPQYDNLYFLCAGRGQIPPLQHPRWIELGFINNTNELLPQCDLYVLPNKDTYFDLIALEVLRAGVPIVLSNTGGNKYFEQFHDEYGGITLYDVSSFNSLSAIIEEMIERKYLHHDLYQLMGKYNRSVYLKYFSMERYVRQYIEAIESL